MEGEFATEPSTGPFHPDATSSFKQIQFGEANVQVLKAGYHYGEIARLSGSRVKPWLITQLERVALPRAAAVIVTSREMERRLAAHPARPRLAYFPNGVDLERFAPVTRGPAERPWRQVLYAGRLEGEKNVARLI